MPDCLPSSVAKDYDPTGCDGAYARIRDHQRKGEVVTAQLCPGNDALQKLQQQFR